ncbi:twin-arginine translocase TatA/TatE family subunit [Pelotomaculum propionicicum]|uniref:Sec-independent protein translocase protein TatA n=1 Tax=Pelotomaculum propionicicum TaxID=258475 RepID=A0A4Y7RSR1_9FIRM|nr:twin-arginine translocase TatA/TatE family subunit [Pelotomaculum propionicicum]NLI13935.1 twin-arginine translocase TatA/TatE family subunit [Peptococcaceae bacterium]TEB12038.1 Sec-independent protein translocase protein TatAy [Pelotomaculum propionicicum]
MPHIGAPELVIIVILALIIFGPGKLPELGKAVGKTIREFRRSSSEIMDEVESSATKDKKEEQLIEAAKG